MNKIFAISILLLLTINSFYAQPSFEGTPFTHLNSNVELSELDVRIIYNEYNWEKIKQEDEFNNRIGVPLRIGFSLPAGLTPENSGTWDALPCGTMLWRLKIISPEAKSLSIIVDDFNLPENSSLFIYDESQQYLIGSFTSENNNPQRGFISHLIPGDNLIIEYEQYPAEGIDNSSPSKELSFHIESILHNYKTEGPFGAPDNLSCMVNINCPEGDNWQNEKRGVAKMLFKVGASWYNCTGSLVNNTNYDAAPYFLTAEHCGGNASASDRNLWEFYFNYERPGCGNTGSLPNNKITGATLIARGPLSGGSDFQLVRLNSSPPDAWNPLFNGWSRSNATSSSGVSIHHPLGDSKKISTYTTNLGSATVSVGSETMANNSAWRVVWAETVTNHSVTEGGSSGSPLFNSNKLIIGTLVGGNASCSNLNDPDFYGKFEFHWDKNGSTNISQLKPWLDPAGTNPVSLGPYDPNDPSISIAETQDYTGFMSVFPNPAQDKITLSIWGNHEKAQITVFNIHGSIIKQNYVNGAGNYVINIEGFSSGIYFIKASGETINDLIKFIKTE